MKNVVLNDIMLWPLLVYSIVSVLIVAGMLGASHFLGQRKEDQSANQPYESGIKTTDSARLRFPSKFYLMAMFFVLFDIESVFIITWAISFRELGWPGYFGIFVFIAILFVILLYELRSGALDIEQSGKKILEVFSKSKKKGSL